MGVNMSASGDRLRVSCAALCRIQDDAGRFLLGLNKNRLAQGREIYMPLGGALEYSAPDLLARFDATAEAPGSRDLRLFLPPARMSDFRVWFQRRQERETSPYRELVEELVQEFAVLPALAPGDVRTRYLRTYEGEASSGRSGVYGAWTHYLHEVFEIDIVNPAVRRVLRDVPAASGLRWVTRGEIERGITADDRAVDGSALT